MTVNDFNSNYYKVYQYCRELRIINMLKYSRFIRNLSKLEIIEKLFLFLRKLFAKLVNIKIFSVNSFPVEICKITGEKKM